MYTLGAYWKLRKDTFSRVKRSEIVINYIIIVLTNIVGIFIFASPVTAFTDKPFLSIIGLTYMGIVTLASLFLTLSYLASFSKMISHDGERIARDYRFKLDFISFQNRISIPLAILGYKINTKQDGLDGAIFGVLEILSAKTGLVEENLILRINDYYYSPHTDDFEAELGFVIGDNLVNFKALSKSHHLPVMNTSYKFAGHKLFSKIRFKLAMKAFKFLMLKIFLMNNLDGFGVLWLNNCSAKSIIKASRLKLDVETLSNYIQYDIDIKNYDDLRDMPKLYLERLNINKKNILVSSF